MRFDDGRPLHRAMRDSTGARDEFEADPVAVHSALRPGVDPDGHGEVDETAPAERGIEDIPAGASPRIRPDAADPEPNRVESPSAPYPKVAAPPGAGSWLAPPLEESDPSTPCSNDKPRSGARVAERDGPSRAARAFTEHAIRGVVQDEDLLSDIQSILGERTGTKPTAAQSSAARSQPPAHSGRGQSLEAVRAQAPQSAQPDHAAEADPLANLSNQHEIFDKIAENMRFAKAYDLGSVALQQRFDQFDRSERRSPLPPRRPTASPSQSAPSGAATPGRTEPRAAAPPNLDDQPPSTPARPIPEAPAVAREGPDWPPPPTDLRPYTDPERAALFGPLEYEIHPEADDGLGLRMLGTWRDDHIVAVPVPQLEGKLSGDQPIRGGQILFHDQARQPLVELWSAWEQAGLLDRIVSFDGGFAPRLVRTGDGERPGSHAYGIAFDINAAANPPGRPPALFGEPGCVRELVQIANRHGFFWGGHLPDGPKGMHFELAKRV